MMMESLLRDFKYHYRVDDNVTIGRIRRDQKRGIFCKVVIKSPPLSISPFFEFLKKLDAVWRFHVICSE